MILMAVYVLPGVGGQGDSGTNEPLTPDQTAPLLRYYSPRLFGAPPQLTNQCDMRIMSSDGTHPGPVGDYYLTQILQDANIVNFVVGRARFIGGMSSMANIIREAFYYGKALSKYNIYGYSGELESDSQKAISIVNDSASKEKYKDAYGKRDTESFSTTKDLDSDATLIDLNSLSGAKQMIESMSGLMKFGTGLVSSITTSLSVQQPFYTFEDDWFTYINNVKMMINTAVIMLGLQKSCVRIGDYYYPIGMNVKLDEDKADVWANYRFITPTDGLGVVTAVNTDNGDTSQYVSFMIDPTSVSEQISNSIGQSQLFTSVMDSGSSVGSEIAFISNATAGSASDKVINLAQESKQAAEDVLKNMSSGNGRFTAAIASSMARSFVGDHTIYPDIFQGNSSTSSVSITMHLTADAGDPYSYLTGILVPSFFIMGLGCPSLASGNAAAYSYPPVIQCNIPGMWGTRLGMVETITFNKNPSGKDVSINGYPLAVDVTITVRDLQHVLVTSPMNNISMFLNNHTMFDYIAQITGVDKYRVNGSMRTVARLALAASALSNTLNNVGDALLTDWHSLVNKTFGYDRQ